MAASAARAGFRVFAADLFGDHDLREVASAVATIRPYPDGLPAAIASFPKVPWIYTGALENHPVLISALAADRPLAGSSPEAVARVRDPDMLARAVRAVGLSFPETRHDPTGLPRDGTWLVKPLASAGGRGIRPWCGSDADDSPRLWQKRIAGRRLSAGFVLTAGGSQLISTSRQLIGRRWCHAGQFAYCGSIDLDLEMLTGPLRDQLVRLGTCLAETFGLHGLVGADLIVDARQRAHVIEINPRPTASLELIERSTGGSLAALHLAAFGITSSAAPARWPREGTWSKAVLFAARDIDFSAATLAAVRTRSASWTSADGWPAVADIPEPPCPIPAGAPVCTVFAHAATPRGALALLRRRVINIEAAIFD